MDGRRPKRRCAARRGPLPSAIHYLGYVEDDETPEMIMRKFEEMERLVAAASTKDSAPSTQGAADPAAGTSAPAPAQENGQPAPPEHHQGVSGPPQTSTQGGPALPDAGAAAGPSHHHAASSQQPALASTGAGPSTGLAAASQQQQQQQQQEQQPLDEKLLLQVFKHTSIFNVRSALANNAVLLAPPNAAGGPSGRADDARGGAAGAGASGDLYADADEITEMLSSGEGPDEYTGQGGLDSEWDYLRAFYSDEEHNGTGNKGGGGGGKGGQGGKSKATGAARKRDRSSRRAPSGSAHQSSSGQGVSAGVGVSKGDRGDTAVWKAVGVATRERHIRNQVVMQYNKDTHALIRRRAKGAGDKGQGIIQMRIPGPPLPPSWGRTVVPYDPSAQPIRLTHTHAPLLAMRPAHTNGPVDSTQLPQHTLSHTHSLTQQDNNGVSQATRESHGPTHSHTQQPTGSMQAAGSLCVPSSTQTAHVTQNGVIHAQPALTQPLPAPLALSHSQPYPLTLTQSHTQPQALTQSQSLTHSDPGAYVEVGDVSTWDIRRRLLGPTRTFTVVLISSGWEVEEGGGVRTDDTKLLSRLSRLPVPSLCPHGFIFVWANKAHIHAVFKQLYAWGYSYVENLSWVWMHANNSILRLPGPWLARSHLSLIIFRKEGDEGKSIHLRHQRNSDVILDTLRHAQATCAPPDELYRIIETMLPDEAPQGRCIELWAPRGVRRKGWVHVAQQSAGETGAQQEQPPQQQQQATKAQ